MATEYYCLNPSSSECDLLLKHYLQKNYMLLVRKVLVFLYDRDTDLNVDSDTGNYYPTVFFNEFWLLRDKLIALNETVEELPLNLEVGPISMTKWQLYLQIEQSFQVHRSYGSMLEGETDELKVHK